MRNGSGFPWIELASAGMVLAFFIPLIAHLVDFSRSPLAWYAAQIRQLFNG